MLKRLWQDEQGAVLSAELVLIGTLAVMGATVGLHTASTAVNEELKEFAFAIRSLDQSYSFEGSKSCGAWTAGSKYSQQEVDVSLAELCGIAAEQEATLKRRVEPKVEPVKPQPKKTRTQLKLPKEA